MKERIKVAKEAQYEIKILNIIKSNEDKEDKEDTQMIQMIKFLKKTLGKKEVLLTLNMKMNNLIKVVKVDKK